MYQRAAINWIAAKIIERRVDFNDKLDTNVNTIDVMNVMLNKIRVDEHKWTM